jgi:hypothetical protein
MGDVHTGDGIGSRTQKTREAALLTPIWGEGGSVLRALGSEARKQRRDLRKDQYAKYLESTTWHAIRARVLSRDRKTCRACGAKARVVHHARYPKNLGEEKLEWLYALCEPCHNHIHSLTDKGKTLRHATEEVLGSPVFRKKKRKKNPAQSSKKKSNAERRREERARKVRRTPQQPHESKKKKQVRPTAEEMHTIQVRARLAREEHERRRSGKAA